MARPRSFQPEETLKQIKALFWQRGYEATSMSDIEQATGLKKQSLYRVFGDKRAMYMASLKDYDQDEISAFSHILSDDSQSARQRIYNIFDNIVQKAENGERSGCFLCNASVDEAGFHDGTEEMVQSMLKRMEDAISNTLVQIDDLHGHYPDDVDTQCMSRTLLSGYVGMNVLAKSGASCDLLAGTRTGLVAIIH